MTYIDHTWHMPPCNLMILEVMVGGQTASGLEGPLAHEVGVNFGITSQIATMALLAVVVLDAENVPCGASRACAGRSWC